MEGTGDGWSCWYVDASNDPPWGVRRLTMGV